MKILSIGTDRKLFEENSAVRERAIEYGKFFEETYIIVFSTKKHQIQNLNLKNNIQISDNVFVYSTNSENKFFYICDAIKIAKKIIKNLKLKDKSFKNNTVISCQDPFETGLIGTLMKLRFGLPLYIQIHSDFAGKYFKDFSLLNKIRFLIAEFVIKYSDRVRVVSERIKKSITNFSKNVDVLPIFAGIKERQEEILEIKKPFLFTLLMVCRLEKEKNIETIFEALKKLPKEIGLWIVGDGGERKKLEAFAQNLKISDRVCFAGWQNNLAPYYKACDIFVSTSFYEGYGVSTVEAAIFGKPLVLSQTGIAGDVFSKQTENTEGSCFICDAKNIDCFVKNILKIFEDKNLADKMGQKARQEAEEHLKLSDNYFQKYADSIKATAIGFKNKNFISRVWQFKKTIFDSLIYVRYLICGLTAAVLNIFSLYALTEYLNIWYLYSSVIAFVVSLVLSFILQKFVVFKDHGTDGMHYQFVRFSVVAILGVITNTILVFVFTDFLNIWYVLSQILAGFVVMFQNFILYKFFIFKK